MPLQAASGREPPREETWFTISAAAAVTQTRTLSGPPSTGASIAMDGGVTDGAVYYNATHRVTGPQNRW